MFTNWKETAPEIESDMAMLLSKKTSNLRELHIQSMKNVSDQVKQSLAMIVIEIIKIAPSELK